MTAGGDTIDPGLLDGSPYMRLRRAIVQEILLTGQCTEGRAAELARDLYRRPPAEVAKTWSQWEAEAAERLTQQIAVRLLELTP